MFVGGVVVHDQVQLLVGVAAGEVAQEEKELLVPGPGDSADDLAVEEQHGSLPELEGRRGPSRQLRPEAGRWAE
jgi:hypothetical protein